MEKPATTEHPIHPLLQHRWSPRAFAPEPVSREAVRSLLEAARWAPSAYNEQPWRFIVATRDDPEAHARLASTLVAANQAWARHAPVLIVGLARDTFTHDGKPNRHAAYDLGQSVAHLTFQAQALGLAVHQMAGFDADKVRQFYGVPEGFSPVVAVAVGVPGEPEQLPEPLAQRERAPRVRRPQVDFAFGPAWQASW